MKSVYGPFLLYVFTKLLSGEKVKGNERRKEAESIVCFQINYHCKFSYALPFIHSFLLNLFTGLQLKYIER
ncbi:hypothetical protein HAX54_040631 [Datura stramonium]|uniref:Uncharacterized protein n=1 Tax=Datura stramonium TaxID=4076 RepID=A0ABS8SK67_DATST|nr:hypothetical protein [Datura stramonium]